MQQQYNNLNDLHIEFDFDIETGVYSFILTIEKDTVCIKMDIEQFENISCSMIRLIKDVNLMLSKKYQARVDTESHLQLEALQ